MKVQSEKVQSAKLRLAAAAIALLAYAAVAIAQTRTTLDIYVVDVEGGTAVLFVTPAGESALIDTGNTGPVAAPRDAGRIVDAAHDAGLTKIDHVIISHYHGDHIGGLGELAKRMPIMEFIDHGPNTQPNPAVDAFLDGDYKVMYSKAKHVVAKPGDKIDVGGVDWRVVSSAMKVITTPIQGRATPNPSCAAFTPAAGAAVNEDDQSLGSVITFGKFRTMLLGDLTLNRQFELFCPQNRIGTLDVLLAGRHGNVNGEFLVNAVNPRVIVTNNGTRKGAPPDAMKIFFSAPRVEDVWQVHFSQLGGQEYTVPGVFIANGFDQEQAAMPVAPYTPPPQGQQAPPAPEHNGKAYSIRISARQDGTFTVTNMRNGFSRTYVRESD
jgi:competence protein ComEC